MKRISWKDISLEDYLKIYKVLDDEILSDKEKYVLLVQIISKDDNILDKAPDVFNYWFNNLKFLEDKIQAAKKQDVYILNDKKYNCLKNIDNLSTAQFLDFLNYKKVKKGQPDISLFVDVLSIILIPDGFNYNDNYDIEEVKQDILSMNMEDVWCLKCFFSQALIKLFKSSLDYLAQKTMMLKGTSLKNRIMTTAKIQKMKWAGIKELKNMV